MSYRLRPLRPADIPQICAIQERSLVLGAPLPRPVMDLSYQLALFRDFCLYHEPEAAAVVVDDAGRVVGYSLGTTQGEAEARWRRRRAAALLARWARRWPYYDPFTRWYYRLRMKDAIESLRHPAPEVPAHIHWNLLPEARGRAWVAMMRHFSRYVASRGQDAYLAEIPVPVRRRVTGGLEWLGFVIVDRAPHHTLTALCGEPVERLVMVMRVDALRV